MVMMLSRSCLVSCKVLLSVARVQCEFPSIPPWNASLARLEVMLACCLVSCMFLVSVASFLSDFRAILPWKQGLFIMPILFNVIEQAGG